MASSENGARLNTVCSQSKSMSILREMRSQFSLTVQLTDSLISQKDDETIFTLAPWCSLHVLTDGHFFFFSFHLFPSGVATANHGLFSHQLTPCHFSFRTSCHLWSSSKPLDWHFQPQRSSTDIVTVPSLYRSKPSQFGFVSKTSKISCPTSKMFSFWIPPSQSLAPRENLDILTPSTSSSARCLFLSERSLNQTASLVSPLCCCTHFLSLMLTVDSWHFSPPIPTCLPPPLLSAVDCWVLEILHLLYLLSL